MTRTIFLILLLNCVCTAEITVKVKGPARIPHTSDGPVIIQQGDSKNHTRPYIHPLRSPDGKHVLTQFSPGHHKHQTGLYWGQTRINKRDFFHNYKGDYWKHIKNSLGNNYMEFDSQLLDGKGAPMLGDRQQWNYIPGEGHYILDLKWTGTAIQDVTIGRYSYGGLFLRMPWKRGIKASCLNSEGLKNQQGEGSLD